MKYAQQAAVDRYDAHALEMTVLAQQGQLIAF